MLKPTLGGLLLLTLFEMSCSPTINLRDDITEYRREIQALEATLQRNPTDGKALRELGVIYVSTRTYTRGRNLLEQALEQNATDPKTQFYLGLAFEMLSDSVPPQDGLAYNQRALDLYASYAESTPPYRKIMLGRYRALSRQLAQQEVRRLLGVETRQGAGFLAATDTLSPTTVGVFPLQYQGQDTRYAALGRGLSELMAIDLTGVRGLTVVERVRIQALLDELAFSQTDAVDQGSAPRRGLLLGAGTVVGGTYNVLGENSAQIDVVSYDLATEEPPPIISEADALANLFDVEKEVVLRVIQDLGIALTPAEQARIRIVPTRNIEAFLAYSRGLLQEDAGQFEAATQFFQQAAALDPTFTLAAEKAAEAESVADAGTPMDAWMFAQINDAYDGFALNEVVNIRLQNLGQSLQAGIVPGSDQREGPDENPLPLPPPPPDGN